MTRLLMCGAIVLGATPALAAAEEPARGFYVAVHGGSHDVGSPAGTFFDEAGTFGGTGASGRDTVGVKFRSKGGGSVGGTIGRDFGAIRFDVDLTYGRNRLNGIAVRSVNGAAPSGLSDADAQAFCDYMADGDDAPRCTLGAGNSIASGSSFATLRQIGAIASLWYDVPLRSRLRPYVGAGLGAVGYHVQTAGDGDGAIRFAYQVGGGAALALGRHVALTVDYRYRRVRGTTLFADDGAGLSLKALHTSLVSGGLRFTF